MSRMNSVNKSASKSPPVYDLSADEVRALEGNVLHPLYALTDHDDKDAGIEIPISDMILVKRAMELNHGTDVGTTAYLSPQQAPRVSQLTMPADSVDYCVTTSFFNCFPGYVVTTIDRTGMRVRHKCLPESYRYNGAVQSGEFMARVTRMVNQGTPIDLDGTWVDDSGEVKDPHAEPTSDSMVLHNAFKPFHDSQYEPRLNLNWNGRRTSVNMDYVYTLNELIERRTIYSHELDLLITIEEEVSDQGVHPFGPVGQRELYEQGDNSVSGSLGLQYRVVVVDNSAHVKERYINLNGQIYQIRPIQSKLLKDGAWRITSTAVSGNGKNRHPIQIQYASLADMDTRFGLYLSYEQAHSDGNAAAVADKAEREYKLKVLELKNQREALEREAFDLRSALEREKMDYDREKITHERLRTKEKTDYERETERREREMLVLKGRLDHQTTVHKNTMEWLKFIPAVFTAVGSLLVFFWGKFKQ